MKKSILLILIVVCSMQLGVLASSAQSSYSSFFPVNELELLDKTGTSSQPYITNLTQYFDYITTMIIHMHFTSTTFDLNEFAGNTALTNGFNVFYDGYALFHGPISQLNIKTNHGYWRFFDTVELDKDLTTPSGYILTAYWHFTSENSKGIEIYTNHELHVYIYDDMTALTTLLNMTVMFKGYKLVTQTAVQTASSFIPGTQQVNGRSAQQNPLDQINQFAIDNQNTIMSILFYVITPIMVISLFLIWRRRR